MKPRFSPTIENKILLPFLGISLVTIMGFFFIMYYTEYTVKLETETSIAQSLTDYICADIDAGGYWEDPSALLDKYDRAYRGDSLFLYDRDGTLLFSRRELGQSELVLSDSAGNRLGWRVLYSLDQHALQNAFIEEQRYLILGAVAMLIIIVQTGMLIAYNISTPIRKLSEVCTRVSLAPGQEEDLSAAYTRRGDELGYLARAFQAMMERLRRYTGELSRVKALNESIVENLPLGMVVCNAEGEIVFSNSWASAMLCRTEERDSQDRTLLDLLTAMAHRGDVFPAPARMFSSSGKVRDYEFGAWKLKDAGDPGWDTLYTINDVTYNKHMEEKLSRDEKLAYTGQLAASVAHEARNPLAGIRAGLQVVGRKLESDRDIRLCQEMVKEVDRVNLLIENLLNLSRQRESEKTTVSLNALCDELMMLYSKVAENKGITLTVELERELWLFADEQELRQILINLINNSIKALPGGGQVVLRGRTSPEGVVVTVADNGRGMDEAAQERALSGQGGGLGLSIVQRLLKQNGGALSLRSAPGRGTQVELAFHGTGGEP